MSKRPAEDSELEGVALKGGERLVKDDGEEGLDYEDEFEDEFESEDEILEAGVDGRPDAEREAEEKAEAMEVDQQTFIVGRSKLEAGQTLSPDLSTYEMLHALSTPWPCLSFDIIPDALGSDRKTYPATMYAVAGTQADAKREKENQIMILKFSGLSRTNKADDSDSESDDEAEDSDPILESASIPLDTTTNRIRMHQVPATDSSRPPTTLTAAMTEKGEVLIHDITPHLTSFDTPGFQLTPQHNKPLSTLRMHKSEGYALDWSPLTSGKLLTGDNDGKIFVTTRTQGGGWAVDSRPFGGHQGSVEELQWSPSERNVFSSASSDGTIKVWDVRSKSRTAALTVQVSNVDVNVMSWNRQTTHLLASGDDNGTWAVWDLRNWKPSTTSPASAIRSTPVASFSWNKEQITSIEWHPTDDSIVAVAAGDDTLTLWDLAVEGDEEESRGGEEGVPPQLLFVHYLERVKECHWHPQIPGALVGTGDGFNVFKTISV